MNTAHDFLFRLVCGLGLPLALCTVALAGEGLQVFHLGNRLTDNNTGGKYRVGDINQAVASVAQEVALATTQSDEYSGVESTAQPPAISAPKSGTTSPAAATTNVTTKPATVLLKGGERILFVGNNMTAYQPWAVPGGLDVAVRSVLASGSINVTTEAITLPMAGELTDLLDQGLATEKIRNGHYDIVVLQGWLHPENFPKGGREKLFEAVRQFDQVITASGAKTMLFMTYPNIFHSFRPDIARYTAVSDETVMNYESAAKLIHAPVAPVGLVFRNLVALPPPGKDGWLLYEKDLSKAEPHGQVPSQYGQLLSAYVFYKSLTGKSPVGLKQTYYPAADPKIDSVLQERAELITNQWMVDHKTITGEGGDPKFSAAGVQGPATTRPSSAAAANEPASAPTTPAGKELTVEIGKGGTMRLVLIPAGTFTMGSPEVEKKAAVKEAVAAGASEEQATSAFKGEAQHEVTISKAFYMGRTEVTQEQYEAVMGKNPSEFKGAKNPVDSVSWTDAVEFCQRLSEKEGRTYRLPTEAEWEYACRAGTTTPFQTGETISADEANYDGNYVYGNGRQGEWRGNTIPVGSFRPNAWGLYDMHGNVLEWCMDWYGEYPNGAVTDPTGPARGTTRVLRGGSWYYDPGHCRAATRYSHAPGYHYESNYGFRVVLVAGSGD